MPYKNTRLRAVYKPKDHDDLATFIDAACGYFTAHGMQVTQAEPGVKGRTGTVIKENNFSELEGVFHYRGATVTIGRLYWGGEFCGAMEFVSQCHSRRGLERLLKTAMKDLGKKTADIAIERKI